MDNMRIILEQADHEGLKELLFAMVKCGLNIVVSDDSMEVIPHRRESTKYNFAGATIEKLYVESTVNEYNYGHEKKVELIQKFSSNKSTVSKSITVHKCTDVSKIISRWAPKTDGNNTDVYIKACATAVGKCLTNSTDITEQTKLGLEYQFSAKDFKPHEQSPMVLYGLVSTMCWIESNYKLEYAMFYVALNMM